MESGDSAKFPEIRTRSVWVPVPAVGYYAPATLVQRGCSMALATIAEAAHQLGISADTVKRRLRRGELVGHQQPTPQGFTWLIELSDNTSPGNGTGVAPAPADASAPASAPADAPSYNGEVLRLEELVTTLQAQVQAQGQQLINRDQQIMELLVVVRQAQAMLPAPKDSRSWWRRWLSRSDSHS